MEKKERKEKKEKKERSKGSHGHGEGRRRSSSTGNGDKKKRRKRKQKGDVKIMTISWNMGNAMSDCFDRIVPFQGGDNDIVALGLQESTYTIKQVSSSDVNRAKEDDCVLQLLAQVKEILTDEFYMVAHNKRAQMQQLIFARNDLRSRVSKIKLYAENTGFFHIFPNKGGLCVNMNVDFTRLAFISCHLAAHEGVDKCAIRNSSVEEILGSVTTETDTIHHTFFMGDMNYRSSFNKDTPEDLYSKKEKSKKKLKEEVVSSEAMEKESSDEEVEEEEDNELSEKKKKRQAEMNKLYTMITKEKWRELLALDELTREIAASRVLCGFKALIPSFPPTFKRIRHVGIGRYFADEDEEEENKSSLSTDVENENEEEGGNKALVVAAAAASGKAKKKEYNLSMTERDEHSLTKGFYHHKRLPSYTDRILTRSLGAFEPLLRPLSFTSCEDASSSDHKPVIAVFKLTPRSGLKDIMSYSPDHFQPDKLQYTSSVSFVVKNLRATNLTEMDSQLFGGGSDPYCTFSADPEGILVGNVKKMKTQTINHELNPNWLNDEIKFSLATNDVDGLSRNCHFLFNVWDYDVGNPDDLIGTVEVSLEEMFNHFQATNGADFDFDLELQRNGQPQGQLMGSIAVIDLRDAGTVPSYTSKTGNKSLHEVIKSQNEAAAMNKGAGCTCAVS